MVEEQDLIIKAKEVMANAYCPYSRFPVGAALLCKDGTVIVGANNENASYGGTICAERSAMCAALSAGHREFQAVAVATQLEEPASPCGMCRQFLVEFGDYRVILASSSSNRITRTTTMELLPGAFTPKSLKTHGEQVLSSEIGSIYDPFLHLLNKSDVLCIFFETRTYFRQLVVLAG